MSGPSVTLTLEMVAELLQMRPVATTGRRTCLVNPREAAALRAAGAWVEGLFVEAPDLPGAKVVQRTRCPDCQCDPCRCR